MNSKNDSLDLRVIHDQIHNLVLARRRGIAFWDGPFETAWAGYVLAHHAPENKQLEIINSIKGEILGERKLKEINKPYDLAACYMIATFLHSVNVEDTALEYIKVAENFVNSLSGEIEWKERFHFYSTPEYVYAGSLINDWSPAQLSEVSIAYLKRATEQFRVNLWYDRSIVYALAGSAYLHLNSFHTQDINSLFQFALQYVPPTQEDNIAILWFLETNWERVRAVLLDNKEYVELVDSYLIELRTRVMRFFPNFVTESFDLEETHSLSNNLLEQVVSTRVVSTIELLMLDELTDRHTISALVVTRAEWERRDAITTIFNQYRNRVDETLERIGLSDKLKVVYESLESNNPANWSQAAMSCRQVLYDLSDLLLKVPDKKYPFIADRNGDASMSLANDKEKNRLHAYMHQMGIRSKNPLLVKQYEFLMNLMRQLIDDTAAAGKRKPSPEYEQVQSLVLQTYLFLGELERLTKFEIVSEIRSS